VVEAAADEPMAAADLEVDFSGCHAADRTIPRCTLPSAQAEIQLWIDTAWIPLIEVDGVPARSARIRPTRRDHGWTAAVEVPPDARAVGVVELGGETSRRWTLRLERIAPTPTVDAIVDRLPESNSRERTPSLLHGIAEVEKALPTLGGDERHQALRLATVLALDAGRLERALEFGHRALDEAIERGELGNAIDIGDILFHTHPDAADQDWILRLLEVLIPIAGDGALDVRFRYARGYRARERNDIGQALDDLAESERRARRLGLSNDELAAAGMRIALLAQVGDNDAVRSAPDRILGLLASGVSSNPCADVYVLRDAAWTLVARRLLGDQSADPRPLLARVAAYYDSEGGCVPGDNPLLLNRFHSAQLDEVRDRLSRDDIAGARELLAKIDRRGLRELNRRWASYIDGVIALSEGRPRDALKLTNHLDLATTSVALLSWKAALLRADAYLALGDENSALTEALAAESVLDVAAAELAPDQGRERMAAAFHASAARTVSLQLAKGDVEGAVITARRARARRLRPVGSSALVARLSPDARADHHAALQRYYGARDSLARELTEAWRLPADERMRAGRRHAQLQETMRSAMNDADAILRQSSSGAPAALSPDPGELVLLYHPSGRGWVGFAITKDDGVVAHHFDLPDALDDDSASLELLEPFAQSITAAQRVRVLAVGELLSVRFHALPWGGEPLIAAKPVAYGLDLGGERHPSPRSRTALVVADPETHVPGLGRLPNARLEGEAVESRLRSLDWRVSSFFAGSAEHSRVVAALTESDWLHYAGHGVAKDRSSLGSALLLSGEAELTAADILSAPRVPHGVVLSACETAGQTTRAQGGMQMATAFLLAGSNFVIAAQGGVADESALRFSDALYRAPVDSFDGPELVRRAVLALRAEGEPMSTWAGFYVWVR